MKWDYRHGVQELLLGDLPLRIRGLELFILPPHILLLQRTLLAQNVHNLTEITNYEKDKPKYLVAILRILCSLSEVYDHPIIILAKPRQTKQKVLKTVYRIILFNILSQRQYINFLPFYPSTD